MTVKSVETQYGGLSGSGSLEGVREYTKTYVVITDSTADGVITVGNALGLPKKGHVYTHQGEVDAGALCTQVDPVQDEGNQLIWHVTCQYSSNVGASGGLTLNDPSFDVNDPLAVPPIITWGSWEEQEVVTHDVNGNAIINSAFLSFDPPITRVRKYRSVTIVRNEAYYPTILDQQYAGKLNSDVFYGWQPLTARLDDLTATSQYAQNTPYWSVRYDIRFRMPDWKVRVWDAGTQYFKTDPATGLLFTNDDGTKKLFDTEDDGVISTNVVFLNIDGTRMSQDDVAAGNANLLAIQVDEALPFSALNL